MAVSKRWQLLLLVVVGVTAYWVLLGVSYGFLESSYFPPPLWWRDHLHPRPVASASWFVLINASGAVLAAMPVAIFVLLFGKAQKLAVGLIIGTLTGLYIMGGSLIEYGLPKYVAAWIVDGFQLLSISVAVLLVVVLFASLPLTIGSSNRGAASSVGQGEGR